MFGDSFDLVTDFLRNNENHERDYDRFIVVKNQ
jgi:hypothetical protein